MYFRFTMINRSAVVREWTETILPNYAVPTTLFDHQVDTMALIKQGRNVFLGKSTFIQFVLLCEFSTINDFTFIS